MLNFPQSIILRAQNAGLCTWNAICAPKRLLCVHKVLFCATNYYYKGTFCYCHVQDCLVYSFSRTRRNDNLYCNIRCLLCSDFIIWAQSEKQGEGAWLQQDLGLWRARAHILTHALFRFLLLTTVADNDVKEHWSHSVKSVWSDKQPLRFDTHPCHHTDTSPSVPSRRYKGGVLPSLCLLLHSSREAVLLRVPLHVSSLKKTSLK